jgi:hypothetical protein
MGLVNLIRSSIYEAMPHVQMEVSQITPNLFVGTNACCAAHYKLMLIEQGVLHDISLEGEQVDAPFGVETYLWLPTPDHAAPTQMALHFGVSHIEEVIRMDGKAYVHCKNGHGRAPTLAAAYLVRQGKPVEEAIGLVKRGRREAHLEPAQLEALTAFAHDSRA